MAQVNAAMSVDTSPDGGYTVLTNFADRIRTKVRTISPVARLARRVTIETGDNFAEPFDTDDMGATWVGENEERPISTSPKWGLLTVPLREIYTSQIITQKLLDLNNYNLGEWLSSRIENKFARAMAASYVHGTGVKEPYGIISMPVDSAGDSTRDVHKLQYVPSGADGAFASANPGDGYDALVDLVHSLGPAYRANAVWTMNMKTAGIVRKFKTSTGEPIWSSGAGDASIAGAMPDRLLGYPVLLDEEMPDIASGSLSIAFGDFNQGYLIVEKPGIKMLQDPFTNKPNVIFYGYQRTGGAPADRDAIKLMKFSAT